MTDGTPIGPTVLIGLFNGARYLTAQLDSLRAQTLTPGAILASDDGSHDGTPEMFAEFAAGWPSVPMRLLPGPRRGLCANYLSLLAAVPSGTGLTALCDQDDVWLPDRLARAAGALSGRSAPALYGARTWETDARLARPRLSRAMPRPLGFAHALVQNFAGGNTMMLNCAALELVQACLAQRPEPVVHDWWLYQIVAGCGGEVVFDDAPVLLYRQHGANQIGAAASWRARVARGTAMLRGTYGDWNDRNITALRTCAGHLTPDARLVLDDFAAHRHAPLAARIAMLRRTGLHRKGRINQAGLWAATLLDRI